jgi:UDP-3-O-[3-hydroxymyristoyl] glucosamine N-acyltransferase
MKETRVSLKKIAELVNGRVVGDESLEIINVAKIQESREGDLSFLYLPSYHKHLSTTAASAVLITPEFEKTNDTTAYIEVDDPNLAFQKVIEEYFTEPLELTGIHDTAFIDPNADLAPDTAVGINAVISEGSIIGEGTKIFHNTVLMKNVKIGKNCLIYPNVTIREYTVIGDNVIVHSGTVIGADGFGYNPDAEGKYRKVPQIGNVVIEDDVEIGANTTIDRAVTGSTVIKKGAKLDNLVQIAHNVIVGDYTAISAQTGISGSTTVGSYCVFGGQVGLTGHLELGDRIMIGAQSGVSKSLKKPGKYFGSPAKELYQTMRLESHIRSLPKYSERIKKLEEEIKELRSIVNNSQKKGDS